MCFDNMKTRRQETEARSQKPGMRGERAVGAGFYRLATGYYRINFFARRERSRTTETQRHRGQRSSMGIGDGGILESWESQPAWRWRGVSRKKLRVFTGKCAKVRGVSRKFAQNRAVNPRCLASQARHKLDAPSGLFAGAKRGRIFTGKTHFFNKEGRKGGKQERKRVRNQPRMNNDEHGWKRIFDFGFAFFDCRRASTTNTPGRRPAHRRPDARSYGESTVFSLP